MAVTWKPAVGIALQQLLELSCCSNRKLYSSGVKLGLIDPKAVKQDSFHYHVSKQNWREQVESHYKRAQSGDSGAPNLSACRLRSSARVQFSVRLVPVAFCSREVRGSGSDLKHARRFGVLGIVQELCSGLLRAELLLNDAETEADIYGLSEDVLADFVARSISLPKLKCAAIHFPRSVLHETGDTVKAPGLVGAWLGVPQQARLEAEIESQFRRFSEKVIKRAKWGGVGHKIRPDVSMFNMDFPPQRQSVWLDLTQPCGKGWVLHTLTRQLRERLDRYNTAVVAEGEELSPILELWIARLCYYPVDRDNEEAQKKLLKAMIESVSYRERRREKETQNILEFGIQHLNANTYPTTK